MTMLLSLSNDLAEAVDRVGRTIVAVHARPRLPSTGIHWRPGVVVTAEHTVRIEDGIRVAGPDGRTASATLVGRDPGTDLAVLRVTDADWPVAELADPGTLRVGHIVLALGHGPRASLGVVSALGAEWRTWRGGEIDRFVRLDLVMYPGFSGGPLVDPSGHMCGVITSGLVRQLELAIPASTVTRVAEEVLATGRVHRAWLGVGMQQVALPEAMRRLAAGTGDRGLIVVSVQADGPAAQAGVLLGDVLVTLDGGPTGDLDAVQAALARKRAGDTVSATVIRAGAPRQLTITLGERPPRRR